MEECPAVPWRVSDNVEVELLLYRAIAFLEEFAEEHPSSFIAEHVNMLAELHMHRKSYHAALNVLQDLYTLERCRVRISVSSIVSIGY